MKQHICISSIVNGEGNPSLLGSKNCRSNSRGHFQSDKRKLHPLTSQDVHEPCWQQGIKSSWHFKDDDNSTNQMMIFQPIRWWYFNQSDENTSTNQMTILEPSRCYFKLVSENNRCIKQLKGSSSIRPWSRIIAIADISLYLRQTTSQHFHIWHWAQCCFS